jgi:hypothetical protein
MSSSDVLKLIQEKEANWAGLRFTTLHNVGARQNKTGDQYAGLSETCLMYYSV